MTHRSTLASLAGLMLVTAALPACTRAHAKTAPVLAPLEVPAPPPRDVDIAETEVPPPVPLPEEPARRPPSAAGGRAGRPAAAPPARPEAPKTEPPAANAPPVEAPPVEEPPKPAPPPILQTAPAAAEKQLESGIRADLKKATTDLERIKVGALNADARTQYETAKSFVAQAQDALKDKKLVFAKSLAEKAKALAAQLAGR